MWDDDRRRLLRLQIGRALNPGIIIGIEGELSQKKRRDRDAIAAEAQTKIQKAVAIYGWKTPPRAKISVRFSFFVSEGAPSVHNLVKYYLDLLKGYAFADDRQVHHIEATTTESRKIPSFVHIVFERLTAHKHRLRLVGELRDYNEDDEELGFFDDRAFSVTASTVGGLPATQADLLKKSRLESREAAKPFRALLEEHALSMRALDPFFLPLGSLPQRGESGQYKAALFSQVERFAEVRKLFRRIHVPVELDLEVTREGLTVGKDLDNIVRDVWPALTQILGDGGAIQGYRISAAEELGTDRPGDLRAKLLLAGEIWSFQRRIESRLERALDRIERD